MSVEGVNSSANDLQVWNNAAFDNGGSGDSNAVLQSWGSLKSIFGNPNASFDSVSEKENRGPVMVNQISPVSLSTPFEPVNREIAMEKSRNKGFIEEEGFLKKGKVRDEKNLKIDEEIEEIESKISLLKSRLEALRLEKVERNVKMVEKRGKTVSSKFMGEEMKKIEALSARTKVQRRGLSLGPEEIVSARRRGMSLGPSEILGVVKSKQMNTPVPNRRVSCFYKLQDIAEEKVVSKEIGKSLSVGPKSRELAIKNQVSTRQAVTTIASKKLVKKEDHVMNLIQGKKLFKDGEKCVSVTTKKPLRQERVVASRYNQNRNQASSVDKKRSLSVGKSSVDATESKDLGTEIRLKKHWEIPSEIIVHGSRSSEESKELSPVFKVVLPRIKIARLRNESPRDSGQAKRVADLIGKKSYFANDDDDEALVHVSSEESEKLSPEFCFVLPRIKIARLRNESPRDSGPAKRVVDLIGKKSFFANDDDDEALVCQALDYDDEEVEEG